MRFWAYYKFYPIEKWGEKWYNKRSYFCEDHGSG